MQGKGGGGRGGLVVEKSGETGGRRDEGLGFKNRKEEEKRKLEVILVRLAACHVRVCGRAQGGDGAW